MNPDHIKNLYFKKIIKHTEKVNNELALFNKTFINQTGGGSKSTKTSSQLVDDYNSNNTDNTSYKIKQVITPYDVSILYNKTNNLDKVSIGEHTTTQIVAAVTKLKNDLVTCKMDGLDDTEIKKELDKKIKEIDALNEIIKTFNTEIQTHKGTLQTFYTNIILTNITKYKEVIDNTTSLVEQVTKIKKAIESKINTIVTYGTGATCKAFLSIKITDSDKYKFENVQIYDSTQNTYAVDYYDFKGVIKSYQVKDTSTGTTYTIKDLVPVLIQYLKINSLESNIPTKPAITSGNTSTDVPIFIKKQNVPNIIYTLEIIIVGKPSIFLEIEDNFKKINNLPDNLEENIKINDSIVIYLNKYTEYEKKIITEYNS
jgi:hypothetical protein